MPDGTEVVEQPAVVEQPKVKSEAELAAEVEAAERERLRKLGFGFPHPSHVERQADGSDKYKADPPPKDYSIKE